MSQSTHFVFLLHHHQAACFMNDEAGRWQLRLLKGEACIALRGRQPFQPLLQELSEQINVAQALAGVHIHVFYGQETVDVLKQVPQELLQLGCQTWQILQIEPLIDRAQAHTLCPVAQPFLSHLDESDQAALAWVRQVLLPIVSSTFFYTDRAVVSELERVRQSWQAQTEQARQAHEETLESLRAERKSHEAQIQLLQQQVQALQLPSMEHLLTYLPAFYRNFFGTVRPDELALLAGTLQVPALPSPYLDPSPNTVHVLRKRFMSLPADEQARVLGFCCQLTHRLEVRPEMADLFLEQ